MTTEEEHRCPPHYYVINEVDVGVCRYCGKVKNFRRLQRGPQGGMIIKEKQRIGGTRGRRTKKGRPSKYA